MNHQSLNERAPLDEDTVIPNKESESSCVCVCVLGTQLCPTLSKPTIVARQAPQTMEFSR